VLCDSSAATAESRYHGNTFRVLIRKQTLISALVLSNSFLKAILAVKNVAEIDIETRETPSVVEAREDVSGPIDSFEGFIVLTKEDQRLDRTAESAGGLSPVAEGFIYFEGLLVMLDGGAIVATGVESIGFSAEAESDVFFSAQPAADQNSGFGKVQRLAGVDSNSFEDQIGELVYDLAADQCFVTRQKCAAILLVLKMGQLQQELFPGDFFDSRGHQSNPNSPRYLRSRSMHFWRVNPMEPTARPSSAATSA
jgi:hypothetical protein